MIYYKTDRYSMLPEVQGKEHFKMTQLVGYKIFEWDEGLAEDVQIQGS